MITQKAIHHVRPKFDHHPFSTWATSRRASADTQEQPARHVSDPTQGDTNDWKSSFEWEDELRRRQRLAKTSNRKASKFVDQVKVVVRAGNGGDGGASFHREKFVARGGPSGGNGGHGGSVYFRPTPEVQSLNRVSKILRAEPGHNGGGEWMNGQGGKDLIVDVPIGTIVREIRMNPVENDSDPHTSSLLQLPRPPKAVDLMGEDAQVAKQRRSKLFVHYPESEDSNQNNQVLKQLELTLIQEQWELERARMKSKPIEVDCAELYGETQQDEEEAETESSTRITRPNPDCRILIAKGGDGGLGNSNFSGNQTILPRFATRGKKGQEFQLELELKTLADIGLVGFPNSGKSTLIHNLTNSRAEVAPYPFTTLNPQIGTLIIFKDGTWDVDDSARPIQDTAPPKEYLDPKSAKDLIRDRSHRNQDSERKKAFNRIHRTEKMRLTIADCPGLLPKASQNVGLGHAFLRHIERSKMLILVVDLMAGLSSNNLSSPPTKTTASSSSDADDDGDPLRCCKDVEKLFKELEAYQVGLSNRVSMVVANKADLSLPTSVSSHNNGTEKKSQLEDVARVRLQSLKDFLSSYSYFQQQKQPHRLQGTAISNGIVVLPISAKFRLNIKTLVHSISNFFSSV